ncbi:MAG: AMP-binding protein [Planctomycetota bacterium]|nr:AMP-binding protein [Planctomycetota bacterium]
MFRVLAALYRTGLLTPTGLLRLLEALATTGANPMALLRIAARLHPQRIAVSDEQQQLSYYELWQQTEAVAIGLHLDYGVRRGWKVAIACVDHAVAIKAIFAVSRLGAHVYLVNPGMSADQIAAIDKRMWFDFYLYDEQLAPVFTEPAMKMRSLPAYHPSDESIDRISMSPPREGARLKKFAAGSIVVMTGGTTGVSKPASRKPSLFTFLPPFCAILTQVQLARYRSVYIATPIYHGFGMASLFIGVVLGVTMYISRHFDARRACVLIAQNKIEVVTLVPLMLQRMLRHHRASLSGLQCIISGGAALSPALAQETLDQIGLKLFNMYGTSEAGVCIIATPELLSQKPESIGRPIAGVRAMISDASNQEAGAEETGRLCIRSAWTTSRKNWIETGDIAYRDANGDVFLCGRVDDMIVSGGENVFPIELENVLARHPDIDACAVIGVADPEFGQRLKAIIKAKSGMMIGESALREWLRPRLARHQMPAIVEFRDELPYTALGKLDKKALSG